MNREFTVLNHVGVTFTDAPKELICQLVSVDQNNNYYVTTFSTKPYLKDTLEKYFGKLVPVIIKQEDEKENVEDGRDTTAE